jgi:hypothetical protein
MKIGQPGKEYQSLSDITDLVGVRIITHYADEVEQIARVIESEFTIDGENSGDKGKVLDPDRFGYLSVHYVLELGRARAALPEYRAYGGMKAEVQVRSILQHAWAENEHDLGYKSALSVPRSVRRRFSRLAGLLELADAEFDAIRTELGRYGEVVESAINPPGGAASPDRIALDRVSLAAYARSNPFLLALEERMAAAVGAELQEDPGLLEESVPQLRDIGIDSIEALHLSLEKHAEQVLGLTELRMKGYRMLSRGTEFLFLSYAVVGSRGAIPELVAFFSRHSITRPDSRVGLAEAVVDQLRRIGDGHS